MTSSPTARLATFAAELAPSDVPAAVRDHVVVAVLDLLGCAIYGSTRPWTRLVQQYVAGEGARPDAVVWATGARTSGTLAGLANGTAAHAAELDDLHKASFFHPGAATVPSALAALAGAPPTSGRELVTAVVAATEVGARVGRALGQGHFLAGYHPQGTVGVFAAAAAAGRVRRLDPVRMRHALGIAGTQAAGLMAAQEGSMVKRLHAGLACEVGVRAVRLAEAGFTGIENVLEASFGGLLGTLGTPESDGEALTAGLGEVWESADLEFKQHAACAAIHSALDTVLDLRADAPFAASEVEEVTVTCTTHSLLHCGFDYVPTGTTAAQMSYQYCIAALLERGRVSVAEFDDALLADPALLALARRVRVLADPELDAAGAESRHAVRVEVVLRDGTRRSGARDQRRGSAGEQLAAAEVIDKFRSLTGPVLSPAHAERLERAILGLEELADARTLESMLADPEAVR